jgi:hypothetical protein
VEHYERYSDFRHLRGWLEKLSIIPTFRQVFQFGSCSEILPLKIPISGFFSLRVGNNEASELKNVNLRLCDSFVITVLNASDRKDPMAARLSVPMMAFGRRTLKKQRCVVIYPSTRLLQVVEAVMPSSRGFVAFGLTSGVSSGVAKG